MCNYIILEKNKTVNKEVLERCFERNPSGCGFAASIDNKLIIRKGFFDFEQLWQEFSQVQGKYACMIHFRFASAGVIDQDNCHPFRIDKNHAMVHNGTLYDFISSDENETLSDTGLFNKFVLKPMFKHWGNFHKSKIGRYFLEKSMDNRSKMVIMNNKGEFLFIRKEAHVEEEGIIWANDGFREFSTYCRTTLPIQYYLPLDYFNKEEKKEEPFNPEALCNVT